MPSMVLACLCFELISEWVAEMENPGPTGNLDFGFCPSNTSTIHKQYLTSAFKLANCMNDHVAHHTPNCLHACCSRQLVCAYQKTTHLQPTFCVYNFNYHTLCFPCYSIIASFPFCSI